jgi:cytochrome c2
MRLSVLLLALLSTACNSQRGVSGANGDSIKGAKDIVLFGCGSCHTIPGVAGAHGRVGPSLAGIAGHSYVAGDLPNQPPNLEHWIQHPHAVHPDSVMPELGVTDAEAREIATFLYSLNEEPI